MDAATLNREIRAYEQMLPSIISQYGAVWALVAHEKLVRTFQNFSDAARYADDHLRGEQVLIRHTDAQPDSAPFLAVCR